MWGWLVNLGIRGYPPGKQPVLCPVLSYLILSRSSSSVSSCSIAAAARTTHPYSRNPLAALKLREWHSENRERMRDGFFSHYRAQRPSTDSARNRRRQIKDRATTLRNRESHRRDTRGTTTYESILKYTVVYWHYWRSSPSLIAPAPTLTRTTPHHTADGIRCCTMRPATIATPPHRAAPSVNVHALCWMLRKVNSETHRKGTLPRSHSQAGRLCIYGQLNCLLRVICINNL